MSKKHDSVPVGPSIASPKARWFSEEFKRETVRLVTDEKYCFRATAVGVKGMHRLSLKNRSNSVALRPSKMFVGNCRRGFPLNTRSSAITFRLAREIREKNAAARINCELALAD